MGPEPLGNDGPQLGSSLGATPSDRPPAPPPSEDGSGVDSLRPSEELLTSFLNAVRRKDEEEQARLRRLRPDQTETFDAVIRAWEQLSPLIARRDGAVSLATTGDELDPGISLHPRPSDSSHDQGLIERIAKNCVPIERYQRPREIARGGMGSIQRVWDCDLRRYLVMKVMLQPGDRDPRASGRPPDSRQLTRFLEEAQITGQLDHPAIVPVHDLGLDQDGRLYFTMPLVMGKDLGALIRGLRKGENDWTVARLVNSLLKAMEAVSFAHSRGVIHRDLKPENIMIGRFGEVYVMDWGLARVLSEEERELAERGGKPKTTIELLQKRRARRQRPSEAEPQTVRTDRSDESNGRTSSVATMDGDMIGTPGYMSPEQARGDRSEIGPRADVWSMGAVMYQLLTGYMPYNDPQSRSTTTTLIERVLNEQPVSIAKLAPPETPQELVAICDKAMAWEPDQRYGSMVEMTADVQAFLEGRVVSAYDTGAVAQVRTWIKRNQLAASLIATMLMGTLLGAGLLFLQQQNNLERLGEEQAKLEEEKLRADDQADRAREQASLAKANEAEAQRQREQAFRERDNAGELLNKLTDQVAQKEREQARNAYASTAATVSNYRTQVLLAELSLASGQVGESKRILASTDPDRRGWEWRHLSYRVDGALAVGAGHGASVLGVAVDGAQGINTVSADGTVRAWDADYGEQLESWDLPESAGAAPLFGPIAAHPSGTAILVRSNNGSVYRLYTGQSVIEPLPFLNREDASPGRFKFVDDDLLILTVEDAQGSYFALHHATSGELLSEVTLDQRVSDLVVDPRGRRVLVVGARGLLALYDCENPARPRLEWTRFLDNARPKRAAFNSFGDEIAVIADDQWLALCEASSGQLIAEATYGERLTAVCYDDRGSRLFLGTEEGALILADAHTGQQYTHLNGHEKPITDLTRRSQSRHLVSTSADSTMRLWSIDSDAPSHGFRTRLQRGPAVLYPSANSDQLWLTTGSQLQTIDTRMLGISDLRRLSPLPDLGLQVTGEGRWLAGISRGRLTLWNATDGEVITLGEDLEEDDWRVTAFGASKDGKTLAVALANDSQHNRPQELRMVLARPNAEGALNEVHTLALEPGFPIDSIAMDSSGLLVYAAERFSGFVRRVSVERRREQQPLRTAAQEELRACMYARHICAQVIYTASTPAVATTLPLLPVDPTRDHSVSAMAVGENNLLALGLRDGSIQLWKRPQAWEETELPFGLELKPRELLGHEGPVHSLAFFPRNERLVSGSRDSTVRLWDTEYGEALSVLREHESSVRSVIVGEAGSRIVSLDAQGRVVFWETEPNAVLQGDAAQARRGFQIGFDRLRDYYAPLLSPLAGEIDDSTDDRGTNWTLAHLEAWAVLRKAGHDAKTYDEAFEKARSASKQLVGGDYERTLGFGQLRTGQFSAARRTFEQMRVSRVERGDVHAGLVLAYAAQDERILALTHWNLLNRLRAGSNFVLRDQAVSDLVRQAESVLLELEWIPGREED